jgi:hypothetical protein
MYTSDRAFGRRRGLAGGREAAMNVSFREKHQELIFKMLAELSSFINLRKTFRLFFVSGESSLRSRIRMFLQCPIERHSSIYSRRNGAEMDGKLASALFHSADRLNHSGGGNYFSENF